MQSDILNTNFISSSKANNISHPQTQPTVNNKYLKSDIFLKNGADSLKRSGEKYLDHPIQKTYGTTNSSNSFWCPRPCGYNLINHSNVEFNILSPGIKNFNKAKKEVVNDKNFNNNRYQSPISEFTHINRVFGSHSNLLFVDTYNKSNNTFRKNEGVGNSFYKLYQSYQGICNKPFTKDKFNENYKNLI